MQCLLQVKSRNYTITESPNPHCPVPHPFWLSLIVTFAWLRLAGVLIKHKAIVCNLAQCQTYIITITLVHCPVALWPNHQKGNKRIPKWISMLCHKVLNFSCVFSDIHKKMPIFATHIRVFWQLTSNLNASCMQIAQSHFYAQSCCWLDIWNMLKTWTLLGKIHFCVVG